MSAGALVTGRAHHTATLLPDGKVLAVGGMNADGSLDSAEVYDPAGGPWKGAGSLTTARNYHTATLLLHRQGPGDGGRQQLLSRWPAPRSTTRLWGPGRAPMP